MIYETTRKNKEADREIINTLGEPFTIIERIKMKGNGCRRMIVESASHDIWDFISGHPGIHYSSIELRPKGVIIYFKHVLRDISWIIPWWQLSVFKSSTYNIHGGGNFVKFKMDKNYLHNEKFLSRMLEMRNKYMENLSLANN